MNITITRTVSVQIDLDEISIDQPEVWMKLVEEKLSCALREAGRDMASEAFERIITEKAPKKGIKEWVSKWVKTPWGDIRVMFPRPRANTFRKLRIPSQTPGTTYLVLKMCVTESFRQSAETITRIRGFRMPRATLWNSFQSHAEKIPRLPDVEPYPAEQVVVEADGTMIAIQREKTKRAEAKIVLAFTERRDHKLVNKVVYASVEPAEVFNKKASEIIRRKYWVDMNTKGVVIGDGASWIESLRDEYFPQMRLQLDLSHVLRKAHEFLSHLGSKKARSATESLILAINTGEWNLFRDTIVKAREGLPHSDAFWDWLVFVRRRWKQLVGFGDHSGPLDEKTSSPCEKYVDLLINRRLKIPGASWTLRGANNMLRVRNYFFNKEDDHSQE